MHFYDRAFILTGEKGNNALSWERRLAEGKRMELVVPACEVLERPDFELGTEVVFEDEDEFGVLQSCTGLKNLVKTTWEGVPMVIVDNHNHVLSFWGEALAEGILKPGATLLHVDQHKDMRRPPHGFEGRLEDFLREGLAGERGGELAGEPGDVTGRTPASAVAVEALARYVNEVTNVGNYIVPAQELGLLGTVHLITSELAMEEFSDFSAPNRIVNVDLDFFAPEMDYIDFKKARAFVRRACEGAAMITVATSPFFLDQTRARQIFHQLFNAI